MKPPRIALGLFDFFEARIAEDETAARQEITDGYGGWRCESGWSSNRVLNECTAKRSVLNLARAHRKVAWDMIEMFDGAETPRANAERATSQARAQAYYEAVCALAMAYQGHSDYDQGWTL